MRKITFLSLVGRVALLSILVASVAFAKEESDPAKRDWWSSLYKSSAGDPDRYQILNINNLWTWTGSDGISNHSPNGDNGTYFPRGTAWLIYQDGIMWGGKVFTDEALTQPAPFAQPIRVGGSNYLTGNREGHIVGWGANAVASDPANARIYRVRRDYASMSTGELARDAAESYEVSGGVSGVTDTDIQDILDRYALDWENWPVDLGAPYIDRNGDGEYTAPPPFSATFTADDLISGGHDEPGIAGIDPDSPADQVVWTVYNDLDRDITYDLQGSYPMGLETQITVWGYKRTDALGNVFFRRARIINKGGVDTNGDGSADGSFWIDSMYVSQWSDPDLGVAGDDLLGVDTTLSLGYVYNGNPNDNEYVKFNLPPPSAGYDFLQGPAVPSPGDVAVFDLKYKADFKNLPMTSFSWFSAGSPISDPPRDYTQGTIRWYKMLRGYVPVDGPDEFYPFPDWETPTSFPYAGDPTTQTGHLDGQGTADSFAPGDRRLNVSTGPFTLAPGDTQEVVVALVCGIGADRFSSIAVMKFNDRFAQITYDALFQVSSPPKAPTVNYAELDGKVILEWGTDLDRVTNIETTVNEPGSFVFEGYNVYQFPSSGASITTAGTKRLATYDLPDDPTVIMDEQFDISSGQVLIMPVQFGSNSGIRRFFEFDRDYVLDIDKIYNGQEYYIAVTAYSRAMVPGFLPAALESAPIVLTVVPKVAFGTEYQTAYGDTLEVEHVSGASDGIMLPIVIDPAASTGDTYEIRFDTDTTGAITWKLMNVTDNVDLLTGQTNQSGDDNYNIIEGGIFLKVSGPPPGVKDWAWEGSRFLTWGGGAGGYEFEGFGGAIGWASPRLFFGDGTIFIPADKLKNLEFRFADVEADGTFDQNQDNVSYGYRHGRGFGNAPALPEFEPFIINTDGLGYDYQDFTKSVPLAVYDMDADPPRRLAIAHLENNQPGGLVDGKYWPPFYGDADNTAGSGPREWLWIMDADYSETPNPDYQVEIIGGPQPVMMWATWARRNTNPWTSNDVMTITVNRPNTVEDVFRYIAPAPTTTVALDEFSADKVGVFPNPYYAFNPAEISKLARFVIFNNLPPTMTIRIFNLAGQLVRKLEKKDDPSQFMKWNLLNHNSLPVASGMYIAYVEMTLPSGGEATKVLKLAIIQEQEVLDVY